MKLLVVGLGSMGKRRIRNLQHLRAGEIVGADLRADRRDEVEGSYEIRTVPTFEAGMGTNPDAVIISTPPDRHIGLALQAARAGKHFFTEAGVPDKQVDELITLCKDGGRVVAAPSCTLRFHPAVQTVKRAVEDHTIGHVLTCTHHTGQYLPDWHPYEDYRSFYVAKRETGACREIVPFELVWLTWVLGGVERVACLKGKVSSLEADIDDVYQLLLQFAGGALGHLLVDVVARTPVRVCRILGERGSILWDWNTYCVRVYDAPKNTWQEYPAGKGFHGFSAEQMYQEEMSQFLRAIRGEAPYGYSFSDDRRVLDVLLAAERAAEEGITVTIAG